MSEQTKCPACGTEVAHEMENGPTTFGCGSWDNDWQQLSHQSELCKLRQLRSLLAECVDVMDRYGTHWSGCKLHVYDGSTDAGQCTCGLIGTLSGLKARIAKLTGGG